jgi:hypothetical protein
MDTLADIRAALAAAGERIERGALREEPRMFMDRLWRQVYDTAPDDLQPYVWARLADFSAQLGLVGELSAHRSPVRAARGVRSALTRTTVSADPTGARPPGLPTSPAAASSPSRSR